MNLSLTVATPTGIVLEVEDISDVVLPTPNGEVGILRNHLPLLGLLDPGLLSYSQMGIRHRMAIYLGIFWVSGNRISILTEKAQLPETIDPSSIETSLARNEKALDEWWHAGMGNPQEYRRLDNELKFCRAQQRAGQH
ncbi:MAG: F0F1 ATP synthase subunit epsilon [Puniceicoccales bacterium]|jgi:F-type H+-transporting ATPase subunit epsilon|nr:F0F1 ATP synthase subunit epsilon [Puniceicoccales bacterium]